MAQPQYYRQIPELKGPPIIDIPEEEFDERLEAMIQHLDSLQPEEVVP